MTEQMPPLQREITQAAFDSASIGEFQCRLGQIRQRAEQLTREATSLQGEIDRTLRVMNSVLQGHESVQIATDFSSVVRGVTNMHTGQVTINAEVLVDPSAAAIRRLDETLQHERAHTGQVAQLEPLVDVSSGEIIPSAVLYEGLTEVQMAEEFHGGALRADAPEQTYAQGFRLVQEVGVEAVASYVQKDGEHAGDRVHMQGSLIQRARVPVTEENVQVLVTKLQAGGFSADQIRILARQFKEKELPN